MFSQGSKCSSDAATEESQIKAPRPKPMESQEFPPEFRLQDSDFTCELCPRPSLVQKERFCLQRRGSLDNQYSILAFINRRIKERSRQRVMSQQIRNMRL